MTDQPKTPTDGLARQLFERAFERNRSPRSSAYRTGVMHALRFHLEDDQPEPPYTVGSVEFDAYCAGGQEGGQIAAAYHNQQPQAANDPKPA